MEFACRRPFHRECLPWDCVADGHGRLCKQQQLDQRPKLLDVSMHSRPVRARRAQIIDVR